MPELRRKHLIDGIEPANSESPSPAQWTPVYCGHIEHSLTPNQLGVFIHIPKTAGTTVYRHVGNIAPRMFARHGTALFVRDKIGHEAWERLFSFAFVRNPWSRMVSMFRFYQLNGFCGQDETFNSWLASFIHDPQVKGEQYVDVASRPPITQQTFLTDLEGRVMVKFIGKMERFSQDFVFVCQKLGISTNPVAWNRMPPVNWREFYDNASRQSILEACQWEIENFDYKFDVD